MGGNYVSKDELTIVRWHLRDGVTTLHLAAGAGVTQCGKSIRNDKKPVYTRMSADVYSVQESACRACHAIGNHVMEVTDGCAHHWMLEAPNGPTSEGTCQKCGVTETFRNSFSMNPWLGKYRKPNA